MDGETDVYGKKVNELQDEVEIGEDRITGNLKYQLGYTEFSSVPEEQEGNFIALSFSANEEGITITTELVNGSSGQVQVTDGFCVYRITNKDEQKIKVSAVKDEDSDMVLYDLSDLTCDISPEILLDSISDQILDNEKDPIKGDSK